ncbi:MAG: hypothetical protein Q4D89_13420 [Arachnia propionica]|uniref:hypothetical protein n=1 Tax=Arachnia propionica TaxID=1750 RepID=UPI0026FE9367|nr:hypothetical protein [Arachnia propionica]
MRVPAPLRVTLSLLLVIGALLALTRLTERTPTVDQISSEPFRIATTLGRPTTFRIGTVTVTGISAATELQQTTPPLRTPGIWLVVTLEFIPSTEAVTLPDLHLEGSDGTTYGGRQAGNMVGCGPAQPGFVLSCSLAMELPPDALAGATLLIPANRIGVRNPDDVVAVDLDLDAARAQELLATAGPVTLPENVVTRPA